MIAEIATPSGSVPVKAYQTETPGLVAHRQHRGEGWVITHKTTGMLVVGGFNTLRTAKAGAAKLGMILEDWSPEDVLPLLPRGFRPGELPY